MEDEVAEETARSEFERKKTAAEVRRAEAQRAVTELVRAKNSRLNQNKPGLVSQEEVAKAEEEYQAAAANVEVKMAELQEAQLRAQVLARQRESITGLFNEFLKAVPELSEPERQSR
jgi:hypothetical protein